MKKMKPKFLLAVLALFLVACSNNKVSSASTSEQLSKNLLAQMSHPEELDRVKDRVIKGLFFQNEAPYQEAIIYRSRKEGSSDVLAVVKTNNKEQVKKDLREFLVELKRKMVHQYPTEVFKLSNAVFEESDEYVILVIDDNIELMNTQVKGYLSQFNKEKK